MRDAVVIRHHDFLVEKVLEITQQADEFRKWTPVLFDGLETRDILQKNVFGQIGFDEAVKFAQ